MSNVFVIDTNLKPCNPVHPGRARLLLKQQKAAVYRRFPFTIILKAVSTESPEPLRFKVDPGSKTTGVAIVNDATGLVVWAAEVTHRGQKIKADIESRRAIRRNRRSRHTRYREPRFLNRTKPKGWLAPSLMSRVYNIETWLRRIRRVCNIVEISMELVKFDMQKMVNPEISGFDYQQGELVGYEVREYLLEKYHRKCVYCSKENVPLQIEHVVPRAKGGSNRVNNLVIACEPCNTKKGARNIEDFLSTKPDLLKKLKVSLKRPLKDAAAVNATRWCLLNKLKATGLLVECGSGALTKYNRSSQNIEKAHWTDAACVGKSTPELNINGVVPLVIKAFGHGNRQMCATNKFGFPSRYREPIKMRYGFQTGDIVKAVSGKHIGVEGRIIVRKRASFSLCKLDIHPKNLTRVHRQDGYDYPKTIQKGGKRIPLSPKDDSPLR